MHDLETIKRINENPEEYRRQIDKQTLNAQIRDAESNLARLKRLRDAQGDNEI